MPREKQKWILKKYFNTPVQSRKWKQKTKTKEDRTLGRVNYKDAAPHSPQEILNQQDYMYQNTFTLKTS